MMSAQQPSQLTPADFATSPRPPGNGFAQCSDLIRRIDDRCTTVRAPRNRRLFLDRSEHEFIYVLLDGLLILECTPIPGRRRILRVFYPGDVIRASFAPPVNGIGLLATVPSQLLRSKWNRFDRVISSEKLVADQYHSAIANQEARLALHAGVLGGLAAEARFASLLIELALRVGQSSSGGILIDLPLSRSDMADYLALNADTLSRIVSRLRHKGVLSQSGRERIFVHDWQALTEESPISAALSTLHSD